MWRTILPSLAALSVIPYSLSFDTSGKEWKNSIIYQVYPRSFKDSDGDGIGDLPGITSKLEHIKDTGADTLYLSPIYSSPMKDLGYDISNYTDIHEEYGTLQDFDKMVARAKELGLKVILDFVPNHTSDEHEWFQKSIDRIPPYDDYYIWSDAKKGPNGERLPPNNWVIHYRGSAWTWNEKRQQYYYHVFIPEQPDLNYRNPEVVKEMENILKFWLKRGVDGFRVDAPNLFFEDFELRDEPIIGPTWPADEYESFLHPYTRDLDENYLIIKSWRELLNNFALESGTEYKYLILEAWASRLSHSMRFYEVGGDPFNFRLLFNVTNRSKPSDFKRVIGTWLDAIPEGEVTNWIVGNHDNHRVATRFGQRRAHQLSMISMILPGVAMIYYGEEIGMVDRNFTFEEVIDPYSFQGGPNNFSLYSRDPERTPFQWDNSTSAGFSDNPKTWLPVHENHRVLNLAAQKEEENSHFKVFQALTSLKKTSPILRNGTTEISASDDVLSIVRRLEGHKPISLLINFKDSQIEFDARSWLNIPEQVEVYTASLGSGLKKGQTMNSSRLQLRGATSVILI